MSQPNNPVPPVDRPGSEAVKPPPPMPVERPAPEATKPENKTGPWLQNTREHAIVLNSSAKTKDSQVPIVSTVTVPPASEDPNDRSKVIPGRIQVDQSFLDSIKENTAVKAYFDLRWLEVVTESQVKAARQAEEKRAERAM